MFQAPPGVTVTCREAPPAPETSSYKPMSSTDSCMYTHTHIMLLLLQNTAVMMFSGYILHLEVSQSGLGQRDVLHEEAAVFHRNIRRLQDVNLQHQVTNHSIFLQLYVQWNVVINNGAGRHLEVQRGFKGHQVRQELQQEHQRLFTGRLEAAASTERHLWEAEKKDEDGFGNTVWYSTFLVKIKTLKKGFKIYSEVLNVVACFQHLYCSN